MKPANKRIFISFLLLLAATTEAPAQAAGSISGTVRDPHGNAIAGASAEIFARGGGMHRITTTNPVSVCSNLAAPEHSPRFVFAGCAIRTPRF